MGNKPRGAFSFGEQYTYTGYSNNFAFYKNNFDANDDTEDYGNPMAGHAIATNADGGIRSYNISMIPIIVVS